MIVLDANILIRAVLGRRVRELIETYAAQGVRFFSPDAAFNDVAKYLPRLLKKHGRPDADVPATLDYLRHIIEPVDRKIYRAFENEGRRRLRDRDVDDWPILATALALGCPVWTEDTDFFGAGVAVWTTNRVEIFLKNPKKKNCERK
jgi:predicted nucleic acid-binding protein